VSLAVEGAVTEEELAQLRRIDQAARIFVDAISPEIIAQHGYQTEWNALCDALFFASPPSAYQRDR
jgi:hypothetical protein